MNYFKENTGFCIIFIGIIIAVLGISDIFSFLIIDILIKNLFKPEVNFDTLDNFIRVSSLLIGFIIALLGVYIHKRNLK